MPFSHAHSTLFSLFVWTQWKQFSILLMKIIIKSGSVKVSFFVKVNRQYLARSRLVCLGWSVKAVMGLERGDQSFVKQVALHIKADEIFSCPLEQKRLIRGATNLDLSTEKINFALPQQKRISLQNLKLQCENYVQSESFESTHCSTLKRQLFAASPSLHPFFYFAAFGLQKDTIRTCKRGRTGTKTRYRLISFTILSNTYVNKFLSHWTYNLI